MYICNGYYLTSHAVSIAWCIRLTNNYLVPPQHGFVAVTVCGTSALLAATRSILLQDNLLLSSQSSSFPLIDSLSWLFSKYWVFTHRLAYHFSLISIFYSSPTPLLDLIPNSYHSLTLFLNFYFSITTLLSTMFLSLCIFLFLLPSVSVHISSLFLSLVSFSCSLSLSSSSFLPFLLLHPSYTGSI